MTFRFAVFGDVHGRGPGRWMTPAPAPIVNGSLVDHAPNRVVALALVDVETRERVLEASDVASRCDRDSNHHG